MNRDYPLPKDLKEISEIGFTTIMHITASVVEGEFSLNPYSMLQGEVPSQLISGMVSSRAFIGD